MKVIKNSIVFDACKFTCVTVDEWNPGIQYKSEINEWFYLTSAIELLMQITMSTLQKSNESPPNHTCEVSQFHLYHCHPTLYHADEAINITLRRRRLTTVEWQNVCRREWLSLNDPSALKGWSTWESLNFKWCSLMNVTGGIISITCPGHANVPGSVPTTVLTTQSHAYQAPHSGQ